LSTAADTSCSREYHAGLATLLGINAALAAERGYIGEERILETRRGFFEAFGGVDGASAGHAATAGLGESWDIVTDMAVKLVPGGHPNHAFAEAAANAARDGHIRASDVACITISRPGLVSLGEPLHPADLIGMAHSLAYFVAAGVADQEFTWTHASPDKISDPTIHELIDKITVGPQPTSNVTLYRQGGSVTIRTYDGRISTSTVYLPKGSGALGIDWDDIDTKYRALLPASGLAPERIEASLRAIHNLQALPNVNALVDLLHPD
jgi:2-methylcitrate dehydratase PrpD